MGEKSWAFQGKDSIPLVPYFTLRVRDDTYFVTASELPDANDGSGYEYHVSAGEWKTQVEMAVLNKFDLPVDYFAGMTDETMTVILHMEGMALTLEWGS